MKTCGKGDYLRPRGAVIVTSSFISTGLHLCLRATAAVVVVVDVTIFTLATI